ncbi:MAG: glycosyltransferase [Vicinamibacteria bacterium]|jgi:glycosyltransferase involved in cell wall biosynthesis|nr:glycosyltransferase [Vicinamibacteria bacterium]
MEAPSQRACSPIKIGEYLACGLSVVTSPVAGDYPQWIAEDRVGVVVPGRSPDDLHRAARALAELSSEDDLAQRCRRAAQQRVGLSQVVLPRYHAVYRRLANPC